MSKKFTGNIKLASAINQTGAQPLDDRVVVASVADLYNSFGTAIYEGMMVVVNDEHAIYVLTDTTKVAQAAGWKKIGDVSGDISDLQEQITAVKSTADTAASDLKSFKERTEGFATAAQGTLATNAVRKVASGTANGTISVTTGTGAATDVAVKGLAGAAYKGVSTEVKASDANLVTGGAVKAAIDTAVASAYKVKGCVANFADLPAAANNSVGDVYNVQNAFTLESKPYPAGTNVVWAPAETAEDAPEAHKVAHWDALGGTVDLSGYALKTDMNVGTPPKSANYIVKSVSQTDGKITASYGVIADIIISNYSKADEYTAVKTTDSLGAALGKLEAGVTEAKSAASSAAAAGVTSIDTQKGDIGFETVQKGVQLSITKGTSDTNAKLKATIVGEAIAEANIADGAVTKAKLATDVQASLGKADNSVQFEANGKDVDIEGNFKTKNGKIELGQNGITIQKSSSRNNGSSALLLNADPEHEENVVLMGIASPEVDTDAANKAYVDTKVGAIDTGVTTFGGQKGAITVDSGKTATGAVNFTVGTDKKLTGTVAGLGTAAALSSDDIVKYSLKDGKHDSVLVDAPIAINDADSADRIVLQRTGEENIYIQYLPGGNLRILNGTNSVKLIGIATPEGDDSAVNKKYVDDALTWTEI